MERIDKINAVLALKGLTGADLSRMIGVSNSIYSQWNHYKVKPSNRTLRKIADVLDVPVESLLADDERPENKKSPVQADSPDGEYDTFKQNMTPEQLERWFMLGKLIVEGKL